MTRFTLTLVFLCSLALCGCTPPADVAEKKDPEHTGQGIIGKTTQDVGKFDPNAQNQVASDQKIHASDPITAPLSAYGPMTERIAKAAIDYNMNMFYANEGRYPKDYEEFMQKIIKEGQVNLPVLPYKGKYKYDEVNHQLIVVRTEEDAAKSQ